MAARHVSLCFNSPDATAQWAHRLAQRLQLGDTVLLDGPVGAGKTHLARAVIQSLLEAPEDVPSPTFTLVQTYETRVGPLLHADLYRLSGADEIEELGLTHAMAHEICLIEWSDRLGPYRPRDALNIALASVGDAEQRVANINWTDPRWDDVEALGAA